MANGLPKRGDTREAAEKSAFGAVYASLYGTTVSTTPELEVLLLVGHIVLDESGWVGDIISGNLGPESHHKTAPPQVCSEQITERFAT